MNKYTINLDWLELAFIGKLPENLKVSEGVYESDNMSFVKRKNVRTRHFNSVYDVYFEGVKIGDFCAEPHSEVLNPELIKFKFDNHFLYEETPLDYIRAIVLCTSWTFNNITRLDLACDFRSFANELHPQEFIKQFVNGKIIRKGKACDFSLYGNGSTLDSIRFGAGASDRCAVLYNKTKELEKSNKLYIKRYHERNLLPAVSSAFDDVYRLEIRLKSKSLEKLFDTNKGHFVIDDLNVLFDEKYLSSLLRSELENYLPLYNVFIEDKISFKEYYQPVQLFEWIDIKVESLKRLSTKSPSKIFKIKLLIKTLFEEYFSSANTKNNSHSLFYKAIQFVTKYELEDFVQKRLKHWRKEWDKVRDRTFQYKSVSDYLFQSKQYNDLIGGLSAMGAFKHTGELMAFVDKPKPKHKLEGDNPSNNVVFDKLKEDYNAISDAFFTQVLKYNSEPLPF